MLLSGFLLGIAGCSQHSGGTAHTASGEDTSTSSPNTTDPVQTGVTDDFVNAVEEGVPNDGSDCTSKLRNCILKNKKVFLPAGTYKITSPISLRDNTAIIGEEGTVIEIDKDINVFEITGRFVSKTTPAERKENISISNITVNSDQPRNYYVIKAKSVKGLYVDGLRVTNMGGIETNVVYDINAFDGTYNPVATAGVFSDDCLSEDIRITNCQIDCGDYTDRGATGIYLQFTKDFTVTDCSVVNAWQGIQFWGGDSAYERGGKPDNPRRCKNGSISNCRASDIGGGGIWGSFGEDITVTECVVARCTDVGIDFEGCHNATASYNVASDCRNGNYATFQYATGVIVFSHNESHLSAGYNQHFFNSNSTLTAVEQDITFDHCTFTSEDISSVNCQSAMSRFTFTNNTCTNTTVNTTGINIWDVRIENNTFRMDLPLTEEKPAVIYATNHNNLGETEDRITVKNNTVTTSVPQTYSGILIYYNMPSCDGYAACSDNTVSGFAQDILIRNNPRVSRMLYVKCQNNTASSIVCEGNVTCDASGNHTADGADITPTV